MKKNSQLHLVLETELKQTLGEQATERGITVSELCRQKLRRNERLEYIETLLEDLLGKNTRIEKYINKFHDNDSRR